MKQDAIVLAGKIPEGDLDKLVSIGFGSVFLGNVVGKKGYPFPEEIPEEEYLHLMKEIKEESIRRFLNGKFRLLNKRNTSGLKPERFYEFRIRIVHYFNVKDQHVFPSFKKVRALAKIYVPKINAGKFKKQFLEVPEVSPEEYEKFCIEAGEPDILDDESFYFFDRCGKRFAEELDDNLLKDVEAKHRIFIHDDTVNTRGEHSFSKLWARIDGYRGYEGYE